jgi:inhibitor of Bruton tyrosine kinase
VPDLVDLKPLDPPSVSYETLNQHLPSPESIAFSKYHMVVLSAEGKVYTNGFGKGGRLGLGHEETAFVPTEVKADGFSRVSAIAAGPDHTIAITEDGRVWTWGSNQYGQLGLHSLKRDARFLINGAGYATDSSEERSICNYPNEVTSGLKRVRVDGCAASKYHSVVFSDAGLVYSWGFNNGQLGRIQLIH